MLTEDQAYEASPERRCDRSPVRDCRSLGRQRHRYPTRGSLSDTSSAIAPKHRPARADHPAARTSTVMHHNTARSSRRLADQLNHQKLSRLQAGDSTPAPPVSGSRMQGPRLSSGR